MMDREYDIFESRQDGSVTWRATVHGLRSARLIIAELVKNTGNEHFAMNLPTGEVVFPVDVSEATSPTGDIKRIFQIAYTDRLRDERTELLRRLGYGIISVIGNEAHLGRKFAFSGKTNWRRRKSMTAWRRGLDSNPW